MDITFKPLQTDHLPLLFQWLEKPHVKAWWDPDVQWTMELIHEKFGTYVDGYNLEDGVKKPLQAFIVEIDHRPVAYIHLYNPRDYPREDGIPENELPDRSTGLDIFVGDEAFVGKGNGTSILKEFLTQHVAPSHEACFVDPDKNNLQAIRAYEKAGFQVLQEAGQTVWMMWKKMI